MVEPFANSENVAHWRKPLFPSPRDKLCRNNSAEQLLERVFQKRDILKSTSPRF